MSDRHSHFVRDRRLKSSAGKRERKSKDMRKLRWGKSRHLKLAKKFPYSLIRMGGKGPRLGIGPSKVDFGYSTSRKLVVEDVVNSGQKMAEEALFLVK